MKKIAVLTGTRADYSPLKPVIEKLSEDKEIELSLIVTGSHLSHRFGYTLDEIKKDGFGKYVSEILIPIDDDSKYGMAVSSGVATSKFAEYFKNNKPQILVVLGDRFEALSAVTAAYYMGIPIAHIAGGDITEGAVDDAIRHCITKMSYLHFPGSEDSAKRIIQMGETPERVFNVGDTSVENCLHINFLPIEDIESLFPNKNMFSNYAIVTFHPVTMEKESSANQLYNLIKAMDKIKGINYLITLSNADAGGREINEIWLKEKANHNNWFVTPSLGVKKYLSALKYSKAVIGNSSSGVVEAPALGIPTVNIGDRQKGRARTKSIIDCQPKEKDIENAILLAISEKYINLAQSVKSEITNNTASQQIVEKIKDFLNNPVSDLKKGFYRGKI